MRKEEKRNILKKYVLNGDFTMAYDRIVKSLTYEELDNLLAWLAYDTQTIIIYAFICYLITLNDCIGYHNIAQGLMCHPLCYIDGAYETALYHNKKILEIDPNNIAAMEMMLFYNCLPDKIVSDDIAEYYAKKILETDPHNKVAKEQLS